MRNITSYMKIVEKFTTDNSPLILTALGVAGTITTAVLTGKASYKASEVIRVEGERQADRLRGEPFHPVELPMKEKAELVWKLYIPAVGTGVMTVSCIIMANRIGTKRAAAMAAAYSLSEKAFEEYREKITEKLGKGKEQAARDELAQERVNKNPVVSREIIITDGGDVLCYDSITGRYFMNSMESIRKAVNDVNEQLIHDSYVSLNEFYDKIGLPSTPYSNEIGWNLDRMLEIDFSTVLSDDGRPCISIEYRTTPIRGFDRLN